MAAKKVLVSKVMETATSILKSDDTLSDSARVVISSLIDVVTLLTNSLGLNSSNSSKPPSADPNRARNKKVTKGKKRKPGGQKGHKGSRLEPVSNPTVIEELEIDRRTLPPGNWTADGFDRRQVFDVEVAFRARAKISVTTHKIVIYDFVREGSRSTHQEEV